MGLAVTPLWRGPWPGEGDQHTPPIPAGKAQDVTTRVKDCSYRSSAARVASGVLLVLTGKRAAERS